MKNPFVGPRAYTAEEHLYGRDAEASRLFHLVMAERIVLLHSPSGAGKTSLLQALVAPRMGKEETRVFGDIRMNREPAEKPGVEVNRYLLSMILSIEEGVEEKQRLTLVQLATTPLPEYLAQIRQRLPDGTSVALIFDQFEMIFSLDPSDTAAKREFFTVLGQVLRNPCYCAIFAMREEFIAELDEYSPLVPTAIRARQRLSLLKQAQAIEAIRKPAEEQKVEFAAAETLVQDLSRMTLMCGAGDVRRVSGPFVEPVQLQVVCLTVWERRRKNKSVISEDDLKPLASDPRTDSVDAALQEYYDTCIVAVVDAGLASERQMRDWCAQHLISPGGNRLQVLLEQKDTTFGLPNKAIEVLEGEGRHLLRRDRRGGRLWTELAHDRLIDPIRRSNTAWNLSHLEPLQRRAAEQPQQLLRGRELIEAIAWAEGAKLEPREEDFLKRSRETLPSIESAALEWELAGFPDDKLLRGAELRAAKELVRLKGLNYLTQSARALLAKSRSATRWRLAFFGTAVVLMIALGVALLDAFYFEDEKLKTWVVATSQIDETQPQILTVREAVAANEQIQELTANPPVVPEPTKPVIFYYAKTSDTPKLKRALDDLGFIVNVRSSGIVSPTNVMTYHAAVPEVYVKLVAFALIRAGIELRGVYARQRHEPNAIAVRYVPELADAPPLTVEEVRDSEMSELARTPATFFERRTGTIQSFDARSGEGTIDSPPLSTLPFRAPDAKWKPGDTVQFSAYESKRGYYAVYVKRGTLPASAEPAPAVDTTATSTTATETISTTTSAAPPDPPQRR